MFHCPSIQALPMKEIEERRNLGSVSLPLLETKTVSHLEGRSCSPGQHLYFLQTSNEIILSFSHSLNTLFLMG